MIGSGILLALTMAVTVAWVYVELTATDSGTARAAAARDEEPDLDG